MGKGITYVILACLIWGLIFIIPEFMSGFTPMEVSLGRYFFYGLISAVFFARSKKKLYPKAIWLKALFFSLISTFGYYLCLVYGLRFCTPAICALVLGCAPVTIAYYGNLKEKEISNYFLLKPSLLILLGLFLINLPYVLASRAPSTYFLGIACTLMSLGIWSWYVVANARFLKSHPEMEAESWATLVGVCTLFWVGLFALCFFMQEDAFLKYQKSSPDWFHFLIGSAILGFLCSWLGAFLWNRASRYLPVSLAGQLMLFETLFGAIFSYTLHKTWPSPLEWCGSALLIIAVLYAIYSFSRKKVSV